MSTRPWIPAAVLVASLAVAGCGEDHGFKPPPPQPLRIYSDPVNPYVVIDNLRIAYGRRDTVEIKAIYDDAYQGSSVDMNDPVPTEILFTKADEVAHVAKLAQTASLNVSILTVPNLTRTSDPGDPPGWAIIIDPIAQLSVSDAVQSNEVDVAHTVMSFKFIPHTPDMSSSTDTTWKIIRWVERATVSVGP